MNKLLQKKCAFYTYSHLVLLVNFAHITSKPQAQILLHKIFQLISRLNPTKDSFDYWSTINKLILDTLKQYNKCDSLWKTEKLVVVETIELAKEEALIFLSFEREKFMKMNHQEAIEELIKLNKIDSKIKYIEALSDNDLFSYV